MQTPTLFIDRDGTLIEEPHDNQVDSLAKVRCTPGVFVALIELTGRAHRLLMVTDRDTDLEFAANLNTQGLWVRIHGTSDETSPAVV